ncbi:MAG: hypothetical protein R6W73_08985, partial [Candidatus Saliniplasma sp.]
MRIKLFTLAVSLLLMMSGFFIVVSGNGISVEEDVSVSSSLESLSGEGTEDDPYLIYDVYDLQNMNDDLGANYSLANDIDASETEEWNGGKGFLPVGDENESFSGTFDGNGYEIRGLYINRPETSYVGLFGAVSRGVIRDIGLVDTKVIGYAYVGSLMGLNVVSTVEKSYATGTVTGDLSVGGLGGFLYNNSVVEYSYAICDVSGNRSVGGLVGTSIGLVRNSYFVGEITGESYLGGLIGKESTYISIYPSVVRNSFWDRTISGINRGSGTGLMTEEMTGLSAKENMTGFDFENTWDVYDNGTHVSYPYLIDNAQEPAPGLQHVDDIDYFLPVDPDTKSQPYRI